MEELYAPPTTNELRKAIENLSWDESSRPQWNPTKNCEGRQRELSFRTPTAGMRARYPTSQKMVSSFIPEATATFSTYRVSEQRQRWIECSSERCSLQTMLPKWRDGLSTIKSCSSGKMLSQTKPSKTECHNPQWKSFMHAHYQRTVKGHWKPFLGWKLQAAMKSHQKLWRQAKRTLF